MGKKEKDKRLLRRNLLGVCVFLLALPVALAHGRARLLPCGRFCRDKYRRRSPQGREAQTPQEKRKQWRKNPQKKRGFSALMT